MSAGSDAGTGPRAGAVEHATPGLARRLACFVYEGVLLFGVVMIAGYLYSSLTQQRHALEGKAGLQAFLFVILAIYFTWFWSHGGQTVAMKAWHIRLVDAAGRPVGQLRAFARYVASWLWFLPSLALVYQAGLKGSAVFGVMAFGVLAYAALAWLRPDRQFWHDALCGTRLITWRPARPAQSAG
ncbi:RDD family protein [Aquabacterium humicola]|uniref:RDD family protein n=1 Tax=Aquabacterium humicola TaxID=3237377 RepID=UPI0025431DAD|nr:RDD family protein [Rubrivivax pictus]